MNIFLDTEFSKLPWEEGSHLLSLALVDEAGNSYSACLNDIDLTNVSEFVKENVISYLPPQEERKSRNDISSEVENFLGSRQSLEFWAVFPTKAQLLKFGISEENVEEIYRKYADFDFQLFKGLWKDNTLPVNIPHKCNDMSALIATIPKEDLPKNEKSHDPLSDAHWNLEVWKTYSKLK